MDFDLAPTGLLTSTNAGLGLRTWIIDSQKNPISQAALDYSMGIFDDLEIRRI